MNKNEIFADLENKVNALREDAASNDYQSIMIFLNPELRKFITAVHMEEEMMRFAIYKLIVDSEDVEFARSVVASAHAALMRLEGDAKADEDYGDILTQLGLN